MHLLSVSGCISSFLHFPRLSRVEGVLYKDPETPPQLLRAAQHQLPAHWHCSPAASFAATLPPSALTERFSLQRRKMWSSRNQNQVTCKDVSKLWSKLKKESLFFFFPIVSKHVICTVTNFDLLHVLFTGCQETRLLKINFKRSIKATLQQRF